MNVGAWVRHEGIDGAGRMVAASLVFGAAAADEGGGGCEDVFKDYRPNLRWEGQLGTSFREWSEGFRRELSREFHRGGFGGFYRELSGVSHRELSGAFHRGDFGGFHRG